MYRVAIRGVHRGVLRCEPLYCLAAAVARCRRLLKSVSVRQVLLLLKLVRKPPSGRASPLPLVALACMDLRRVPQVPRAPLCPVQKAIGRVLQRM